MGSLTRGGFFVYSCLKSWTGIIVDLFYSIFRFILGFTKSNLLDLFSRSNYWLEFNLMVKPRIIKRISVVDYFTGSSVDCF